MENIIKTFQNIVANYLKNGSLPLYLLSFDAVLIYVEGNKLSRKDRTKVFYEYRKTLLELSKIRTLVCLHPDNVARFGRRCRIHFKKYRTYLGPMISSIQSTTGQKTSLTIRADAKINKRLAGQDVIVSKDGFVQSQDGQIYRVQDNYDDKINEAYEPSELDSFLKKGENFTQCMFIQGFGSIKWLSCLKLVSHQNLDWLVAVEAVLSVIRMEDSELTIIRNVRYAEMRCQVISKGWFNTKMINANFTITIPLNNDSAHLPGIGKVISFGEDFKLSQVLSIIFEGEKSTLSLIGNDLIDLGTVQIDHMINEYLNAAVEIKNSSLDIRVPLKFTITNLRLTDFKESIEESNIISRLEAAENTPPTGVRKLLICANKGAGKTSLTKYIRERATDQVKKPFIIDSDDWGIWLYILSEEVVKKDIFKLLSEVPTQEEVTKATEIFVSRGDGFPSIFNCIAQLVVIKNLQKLFVHAENKYHSFSSCLESIYDQEFVPPMVALYQQLLKSDVLSIRQFELQLMRLPAYKEASYIIQFCHTPVETNAIENVTSFVNYLPIYKPEATFMFRGFRLCHDQKKLQIETPVEPIVTYITDYLLYTFYERITAPRVILLYMPQIKHIVNMILS